jgi:hypothetical protein
MAPTYLRLRLGAQDWPPQSSKQHPLSPTALGLPTASAIPDREELQRLGALDPSISKQRAGHYLPEARRVSYSPVPAAPRTHSALLSDDDDDFIADYELSSGTVNVPSSPMSPQDYNFLPNSGRSRGRLLGLMPPSPLVFRTMADQSHLVPRACPSPVEPPSPSPGRPAQYSPDSANIPVDAKGDAAIVSRQASATPTKSHASKCNQENCAPSSSLDYSSEPLTIVVQNLYTPHL